MAKQGQVIDLGNSGVRMIVTISARDTNGQLSQIEAVMQAGKKLPALPHYHPAQEEKFEVISGELTTLVDGKIRKLTAGESLIIHAGQVHNFWNDGAESVSGLVEHRPDWGFQNFVSTLSGLVRDGKLKYDNSFSDKMQMAVVADYYKDFMKLTIPLRFVIKIVAAVGRIRGKKGYLPEYFEA
jgi:quercetin dioxygenase-like cupin family protein